MSEEMRDAAPSDSRPLHRRASHWLGFLASGGLAFTTDACVLALLTKVFGVGPFVARIFAIAVAVVVGWLSHRRLTFAVAQPPSLKEFFAFATLQWMSMAVNYAIYAAILLARPATEPLAAMIAATFVSMVISYLGMRFGVFARR